MIRTRGTGYKYIDTSMLPRMSKESIVRALYNARIANNRYQFKSFFVKSYVTPYVQGFEEYWRMVFDILSSGSENVKAKLHEHESCNVEDILDESRRKEAHFIQSLIQNIGAMKMRIDDINEDQLSAWRTSFARVKKQIDQIESVEALARYASAMILKKETPERLRSLCESKAKKLGMDPEGSEFFVAGFVEILESLLKLAEQESRGLRKNGVLACYRVDPARVHKDP